LVKKRLARMRPARVRPAQKTGDRPSELLQLDWAEMPTRPKVCASGASMRGSRACRSPGADAALQFRSVGGVVLGGLRAGA
jgi:hypothetical protein